jgi:hypothetical protein
MRIMSNEVKWDDKAVWLEQGWEKSRKSGNPMKWTDSYNTVIFKHEDGSGWGVRIVECLGSYYGDTEYGDPTFLPDAYGASYASVDEAKLAALEYLRPTIEEDHRKHEEYMAKCRAEEKAKQDEVTAWIADFFADGPKTWDEIFEASAIEGLERRRVEKTVIAELVEVEVKDPKEYFISFGPGDLRPEPTHYLDKWSLPSMAAPYVQELEQGKAAVKEEWRQFWARIKEPKKKKEVA